MTTARKFYLTFMKLAKQVDKSNTKAQLSKSISKYVQPLAECFDDDGLNIMDDYKLIGGFMVTDYSPEYPLLNQKCDPIHRNNIYVCTKVQKPVKSYVDNKLVATSKKTYEYLKYPNKKLVQQYMRTLLNKALDNTMNRHNDNSNGGFWVDRSGITPLEEYHMLNALGIQISMDYIKTLRHQAKIDKISGIKDNIKTEQFKVHNLKSKLNTLNK